MNLILRECELPNEINLKIFEKSVKGMKSTFHLEITQSNHFIQFDCTERHANSIYNAFTNRDV